MKKISVILTVLLCAVMLSFTVACSVGAPEYSTTQPDYVEFFDEEKIQTTLAEFLSECKDRTTYSTGEKNAAIYLYNKLLDYGYGVGAVQPDEPEEDADEAETQDATSDGTGYTADLIMQEMSDADIKETAGISDSDLHFSSYNVVAVYRSDAAPEKAKNVIIGAYYDNRYYAPEGASVGGFKAEGALSNGTGVATLLAIAEYLCAEKPQLEFTVTVVFFGASFVSDVGAQIFLNDKENSEMLRNTVLMVELQRICADYVYAFSDARSTEREPFFDSVAEDNGYAIYKPTQKTPAMQGYTNLNGVPFAQWAHVGNFAAFFNIGIPTLNVIGANWETMATSDVESKDYPNVTLTSQDTLDNLVNMHPDYADNMRTAASFVVRAMESEAFLSTMEYDRANFPNTDIVMKDWIWYLVALGVLVIAVVIIMFVSSRITKKYPVTAKPQMRMKMAVFGMDYEDKNSADVFIDVKNNSAADEIFSGVPNNEPSHGMPTLDPFGGIFGLNGARIDTQPQAPEKSAREQLNEPTEEPHVANSDDAQIDDKTANDANDVEAVEAIDSSSAESQQPCATNAVDGESDVSDGSKSDIGENATASKSASGKTTQAKRKTVSAGKSTSAKKSSHGTKANGENKDGE